MGKTIHTITTLLLFISCSSELKENKGLENQNYAVTKKSVFEVSYSTLNEEYGRLYAELVNNSNSADTLFVNFYNDPESQLLRGRKNSYYLYPKNMEQEKSVSVKGISWLGVKTAKFEEMCNFYESILELKPVLEDEGFKAYNLPNGDRIEVFDSSVSDYDHFNTGPVAGFLVDNIERSKKDMEASGIEFFGDIGSGIEAIDGQSKNTQWAHFRGPDGNIYELKSLDGVTD